MKAQDLRIGNYLKVTLNSQTSTEGITASGIMDIYCNKDNTSIKYEPIPLTEEVLLKCGFEMSEHGEYFIKDNADSFDGVMSTKLTYNLTDELFTVLNTDYDGYHVECKHLHHLQNLYFALTGEELKIEL